ELGLVPSWRRGGDRQLAARGAGPGGGWHARDAGADRAGADERSGDRRGPPCGRRLRAGRGNGQGARDQAPHARRVIPPMRLGTRFAARVPGSVAGLAAVFWMAAGPPDVHAQEVTGEPAEPDYFVVEGRVFTADGRTPRGLRVFVRTPARTDSAAVRPTGEFAVVTVVQAADSVEVFIDAADRDARWYYPSWVRLSPEELWEDLRFVL